MGESDSKIAEFSRIRKCLWPVHRCELKKLLPMLLIFFFISFNYNVLRTMKDTLVVTAKSSGAEVIPFIKVWAMLPGSILLTFVFTWLSNRISREKVFYLMIGSFLLYFALFAFYLYPMRETFHPNALCDFLELKLSSSFKWMIMLIRNWTFTLFYVMSELWGNIVLFLLFWGFANQVTRLEEAKRFYGILGIGANFSGIFAGQISVYLSKNPPSLFAVASDWEQSMRTLVTLVVLSGLVAMLLFRWIHTYVLGDERFYDPSAAKADKAIKGKLSFTDSIAYLLRSRYLLSIAVIVIAYNVVINLVEVVWKSQVKELFSNPNDFNIYINQVSTIIGIVATLAALFVSGNVIRKFGWTFTAMLTPIILLATSVIFFGLFFYKEMIPENALLAMGMTSTSLLALVGSMQNVLSRGAKYTVFDATKEMAFVPLSSECKIKGKSTIDGICNRFGKSGGSFIHQNLLLVFVTFTASAPYVFACLLGIIFVWFSGIRTLGKKFDELSISQILPVSQKKDGADVSESDDEYSRELKEQRAVS